MYISPLASNLKDMEFPQIRLGLQGAPGTGKSFCMQTFPQVTAYDRDNSLTALAGKNITVWPMWDDEFVAKLSNGKWSKPPKPGVRLNRRDACKWLLETEGPKLEAGQTLFIDSWSSIQDDFDHQTWAFPKYTKKGEIDDFAPWAEKIDYASDLMNLIMTFKCHVVVTFHEIQVRDPATGVLLDKVSPLMQGKFVAELKRFFTDFFRTKNLGRKPDDFVWQVKSDKEFDAKTRLTKIPSDITYVEPTFEIFKKYGYDPKAS